MSVSLMLAMRYLRVPVPRALKLYLFPIVAFVLLALVEIFDVAARRSTSARILGIHANLAAYISAGVWILAVLAVLVLVFVITIRHLTIFTTISSYGMFLGTAALIVVMSVMSGFEGDIKHKILGTHAQVVISRPDDAFTDWAERMPQIAATKGVVAVTPFLSSEAMISSPRNRSNVVVKGIDPVTVGGVTDLRRNMEVGELDDLSHPEKIRSADDPELERDGAKPDDAATDTHALPEGIGKKLVEAEKIDKMLKRDEQPAHEAKRRAPPGIVVGRELAKSLSVYVGDDVSLVSPTGGIGPSGVVPKARPYRVAGIFYSGMFEYDSKFVYVTMASAQKLFDQADEATGLEVKVPDADHTEDAVAALGKLLGPGYEIADWKSLNRSLFSALALEKIVMFIFLSFIVLVAAFSIVANGQMLATRKVSEIAMLKSMGATDSTIAAAFVWLGLFLGGIGVTVGVALGLALTMALNKWGYALDPDVFYLTKLPVHIDWKEILVVAISGLAITIAATLYPAWSAARLTPVEGLREGGH